VPQSKLNIESYVNDLAKTVLADAQSAAELESGSLESVLRGLIESHRARTEGDLIYGIPKL
jgi:hypothetical protein